MVGFDLMEIEVVFVIMFGGVFIGVIGVEVFGELKELFDLLLVGYWIGWVFQGYGYVFEVVDVVLVWVFEVYLVDVIVVRVYEDNI